MMARRQWRLRRAPAQSGCGIAHHGHRLDHRSGGDLAECDGIEELRSTHPVIGRHGVMLHEWDDDEPSAIGQRTDLQCDPGQCT